MISVSYVLLETNWQPALCHPVLNIVVFSLRYDQDTSTTASWELLGHRTSRKTLPLCDVKAEGGGRRLAAILGVPHRPPFCPQLGAAKPLRSDRICGFLSRKHGVVPHYFVYKGKTASG